MELGNGRPSRRRGVLFIERCLDFLKPGGVVAIVGGVVALVALALAIGMKSRGAALALVGVIVGAVPGALFYHQYRLARKVPPISRSG